jgi:radical SAM superfamily enzyme YgiQ (UPF0313 family)
LTKAVPILKPGLLEQAVESGLRSLFVGFETLSQTNLRASHKFQNLNRDYAQAIRLHDCGVIINGSFVFGMDDDDVGVFDRTVDWAVAQGIETATFHILTPNPGTGLHTRIAAEGRIRTEDWDLYDTRHGGVAPAQMTRAELEAGYWRAYRDFYRWGAILRGASAHDTAAGSLRHLAYSAGWKKFEPLWDTIIRAKRASAMLPGLEAILHGFGLRMPRPSAVSAGTAERTRKELTRMMDLK